MRTALRIAMFASALVFAGPRPALAEWQFVPLIGYTFKGATSLVDLESAVGQPHWHLGGAVALLGDGPIGVEGLFLYTPGLFQRPEVAPIETRVTSSRSAVLMGNAVLTLPRRWTQYSLRPYASGGLGLLHASANDLLNIFPIDLDLLGMNVGGGAVGFVTERVGVRFDLRYFRKISGPAEEELESPISFGPIRLRYWTTSLGVVIRY